MNVTETPIRMDYEVFFKWYNEQLNQYATKKNSLLTDEILYQFYDLIIAPTNDYSHLEYQGFSLIKTLFKMVNEKDRKIQILNMEKVKTEHGSVTSHGSTYSSSSYNKVNQVKELIIYVHPDNLKGIDTLWKIMSDCNNIGVTADCIVFIGSIYHNVSDVISEKRMEIEEDLIKKCIDQIDHFRNIVSQSIPEEGEEYHIKTLEYQKEFAIKQIERNCLHIKSFMENSEMHGLDNFLQFNTLVVSGEQNISITVFNKISWGQGCYNKKINAKRFKFKILSSTTLWTLKKYLAEKLVLDPLLLKIERIGLHAKEFKDSENWQTLHDLGITNEEKFSITTKLANTLIDHLNLLFSDQTLTPEADKMFTQVFNTFMNADGLMDHEGCTGFLKLCTGQSSSLDDPRVKRLFNGYDKDEDGLLK